MGEPRPWHRLFGLSLVDFFRGLPVRIELEKDLSLKQQLLDVVLIRKEAGIEKGSGQPNKVKVGKITRAKVRSIAEIKMNDLNANSLESAMRMIEGTARSMGVEISG